jgi:GR25 family glycosyltransferase involved in LPS biosynthesis
MIQSRDSIVFNEFSPFDDFSSNELFQVLLNKILQLKIVNNISKNFINVSIERKLRSQGSVSCQTHENAMHINISQINTILLKN